MCMCLWRLCGFGFGLAFFLLFSGSILSWKRENEMMKRSIFILFYLFDRRFDEASDQATREAKHRHTILGLSFDFPCPFVRNLLFLFFFPLKTPLIFPSFTIQFTTMNAGELLANSLSPGTLRSPSNVRPSHAAWMILASARRSLSSAPQRSPFLVPPSLIRSSYA
jgi:hypothetical protein